MRERLVATLVGLTIAVIGLYGIPRAYFLADLVRDRETTEVERTATVIALLVVEREADGGVVDEELLRVRESSAPSGVEYVAADGRPVVIGRAPSTPTTTRPSPRPGGSDRGATLTVSLPGTAVQQEVREAIEPLVVLGVALALLAAGCRVRHSPGASPGRSRSWPGRRGHWGTAGSTSRCRGTPYPRRTRSRPHSAAPPDSSTTSSAGSGSSP